MAWLLVKMNEFAKASNSILYGKQLRKERPILGLAFGLKITKNEHSKSPQKLHFQDIAVVYPERFSKFFFVQLENLILF